MEIRRDEWKHILTELTIKHGTEEIIKELNISKPTLYNWLNRKTIPHDNIKLKIIKKFEIKPQKLIKRSKSNKRRLEHLSKTNPKHIINVAALVNEEIKIRSRSSANTWYLEYIDDHIIKIRYFDSNRFWKTINIPTKIKWNTELAVIMGFWMGDGVTKKPKLTQYRPYLTFVNRDIELLKNIKKFFIRKMKQKQDIFDIEIVQGGLFEKKKIPEYSNELKTLCKKTRWRIHGMWNSIGVCLHIRNSPLAYIFNHLLNNIEPLLNKSTKQIKGAFLAGYFSAEGNVSRINRWFSFHETKLERRRLIQRTLSELGFIAEDFGDRINIAHRDNIREKDTKLFNKFVKKYLISNTKKDKTDMLMNKKYYREIDLIYIYYIYLKNNVIVPDIVKDFEKNKDHINRILRRLEENKPKLVNRTRVNRNEFNKITLTTQGNELVENNIDKIKEILLEIKRLDKYNRHYKSSFILQNPETNRENVAIRIMIDSLRF